MFSFQGTIQNLKRFNEIPTFSVETSVSLLLILYSLLLITLKEWWAKDSLSCGKATAVTTVHRTVAKSRLSSPFWHARLWNSIVSVLTTYLSCLRVVGQNGLEPSTSRLSVVCSSQLSYWPIWWRLAGSNRWPPACKAGALPAELNPHLSSRLFF